jgi:hypothetical protein
LSASVMADNKVSQNPIMERGRGSFVSLVVFVAMLVLVLGIYFAVFAERRRSNQGLEVPNLKLLATAMVIYTGEYDTRFPPKTWHDEIKPFTRSEDVFSCEDILAQGKHWGFAFNWELLGRRGYDIEDPSNFPMIFETDALAKDVVANLAAQSRTRHGNGSHVARCDSSSKYVEFPPNSH